MKKLRKLIGNFGSLNFVFGFILGITFCLLAIQLVGKEEIPVTTLEFQVRRDSSDQLSKQATETQLAEAIREIVQMRDSLSRLDQKKPRSLVINFSEEISKVDIAVINRGNEDLNQSQFKIIGDVGTELGKDLLGIDGVNAIHVLDPYKIQIWKGEAFSWEWINLQLQKVISEKALELLEIPDDPKPKTTEDPNGSSFYFPNFKLYLINV